MNQTRSAFPQPRMVTQGAMRIVGVRRRYSDANSAGMPGQWQAFIPFFGKIAGQKGNVAFGVLYNGDDAGNMDYLTGVEVSGDPAIADGLQGLRIAPQTYAVFAHEGHVSEIRQTWQALCGWMAATDLSLIDAPRFERYGEGFNPQSGNGDMEIWIPVAG